MSQAAGGSGEAYDAQASSGDSGVYDEKLHRQLKAVADHAELSVGLAEQQIEQLQEALEGRREHARQTAAELAEYEQRHNVTGPETQE